MALALYRPGSGEAAAAAARMSGEVDYARSIGYHAHMPDDLIREEKIYLFAVFFSDEEMAVIARTAEEILFFDHRDANIQEMKRIQANVPEVAEKLSLQTQPDIPMTMKVWEHFFPGEDIPDAVYYFGKYMTWDLEDPSVLHFHYGISVMDTGSLDTWQQLIRDENNEMGAVMERGRSLYQYYDARHDLFARFLVYETVIDGVPATAANTKITNSLLLAKAGSKYTGLGIMYQWFPKYGEYSVSLLNMQDNKDPKNTDYISAGHIARNHGGGGSSQAAGFRCRTLPFEENQRTPGASNPDEDELANLIDPADARSRMRQAVFSNEDTHSSSSDVLEENPILSAVRSNNWKEGYCQQAIEINGCPVIAANLPHMDWPVNSRLAKAADIQMGWYWDGLYGAYGVMLRRSTTSGTDTETLIQTLGLNEQVKAVNPGNESGLALFEYLPFPLDGYPSGW